MIGQLHDDAQLLQLDRTKLEKQRSELLTLADKSNKLQRVIEKKKDDHYQVVNRLRKERRTYEQAERQLERQSIGLTDKILKLTDGASLNLSDLVQSSYQYPCNARITSGYGYRRHPVFRVRSFHTGIDLGARHNTPIKAANGGIIVYAGWYSGYGNTVIVSHGKQKTTLYAHLNKINVRVADKVTQGTVLGKAGATGIATGPHLHFEYRVAGKTKNPTTILN